MLFRPTVLSQHEPQAGAHRHTRTLTRPRPVCPPIEGCTRSPCGIVGICASQDEGVKAIAAGCSGMTNMNLYSCNKVTVRSHTNDTTTSHTTRAQHRTCAPRRGVTTLGWMDASVKMHPPPTHHGEVTTSHDRTPHTALAWSIIQ